MNLITLTDPRSAAAEAFQSLRTNLEFSGIGQELHTLLLAAVDAGSKNGDKAGSAESSIAIANLAVVMAQAGDRVILVDGDLRRPHQHEIFGLNNGRGLATWLADGGTPALQKTAIDNLSVLTAGPLPSNPVALLTARRLDEIMTELRSQAEFVLIDAPPVLAVTDAALWARKVDGVVLLLNAGGTKRDDAQRAKTVLEKVQAHVLGAVLLDADRDVVGAGYGA